METEMANGDIDCKSETTSTGARRREAIRAALRRPARVRRHKTEAVPCAAPAAAAPPDAKPQPIFVSYARHNLEQVRPLVVRLRQEGAAVTWDQDFLGGEDFRQSICRAIDAAPSVIVVWSPESARSAFVCDEALRALKAAKLITTHVPGFDLAHIPLGFGHLHTVPVDDQDTVRNSLAERGIHLRA
jgi:TIR domain